MSISFAFFSPDSPDFQVYKAKTHEGQQIALKVMRPGVARLVACDWVCWFLALKLQRLRLGLN